MAKAGSWSSIEKVKLSQNTLVILQELHFDEMTPVQAATIPLFLSYKDVVVEACTGSGKTLAFVIPIVEILNRLEEPLKMNQIGAIIITPTRELALQIFEVVKIFASKFNFSRCLLIGGNDIQDDILQFRKEGGNIVVATPGRLEYVMKYNDFVLKYLEVLVLDEADRLLELGFKESLNSIIQKLPKQRRTGLFSATQTHDVNELIRVGLRNPVKVQVKIESQTGSLQRIPQQLDNFYTICEGDKKLPYLIQFVSNHQSDKFIIYFLTCACVNYFYQIFRSCTPFKKNVLSLHGKLPTNKRIAIYNKFLEMKEGILLCTDVAARGLDIPEVDWIIQYDPPQDPDTFVHRIGRTARMGRKGEALIFLMPSEETYIEFLSVRKIPIKALDLGECTNTQILENIKTCLKKQREFFEKGHIAFVSFIRAYKENRLNYIFRLSKLDIGKVAQGFGLIQLPKMPELKGLREINFVPENMDFDSIPYSDKIREAKRLKLLEERKQKQIQAKDGSKKRKMEELEEDKEKEEEMMKEEEEENDEEDFEELANEAKLMKKLKKRKLSLSEFEKLVDDDLEEKVSETEVAKKKARNNFTKQIKKNKKQIKSFSQKNKNFKKNYNQNKKKNKKH